jgi:hypothetical protein
LETINSELGENLMDELIDSGVEAVSSVIPFAGIAVKIFKMLIGSKNKAEEAK